MPTERKPSIAPTRRLPPPGEKGTARWINATGGQSMAAGKVFKHWYVGQNQTVLSVLFQAVCLKHTGTGYVLNPHTCSNLITLTLGTGMI